MGGDGDEALARPGGGGEDDVGSGDELEDRLLLRLVERAPALGRPRGDRVERGARLEGPGHRIHEL